jgi:hypothetical protein
MGLKTLGWLLASNSANAVTSAGGWSSGAGAPEAPRPDCYTHVTG